MKTHPTDIARALVDLISSTEGVSVDQACDSALALLKRACPGTTQREFLKLVEREARHRGIASVGLLAVPSEQSLKAESIAPLLSKSMGKTVMLERAIEPELIGGAVVLLDHRRIDCSVQGALRTLLQTCLLPLH